MRPMPWSISPRLSQGCMTYSLLSCQVLSGEGRSFATLPLRKAHKPSKRPIPTKESKKFLTYVFILISPLHAVDWEAGRVLFGVLRIENCIGEFGGSQILRGDFYAQFLHRFLVNIRPQHLLGDLLIV